MNERIQKLAEQASEIDGDDLLYYHPVFAEKFAELIVRECAELFDKDEIELTLTERTIHNTIKEHFGVKE